MPAPAPLVLTSHLVGTLQHNTFEVSNYGISCFFAVGNSLYLVVREQFPSIGNGALNNFQVWKSTDKTTWVLMADIPNSVGPLDETAQSSAFVLSGGIIYMLFYRGQSVFPLPPTPLQFHRYDTSTDTLLSETSPTGPDAMSNPPAFTSAGNAVTVLNSGRFLVTQQAPTLGVLNFYVYNPVADTWGAGTQIAAAGAQVVAQVHDPTTDLTFVFYLNPAGTQIRCATITAALTVNDALVQALNFTTANGDIGQPCINPALNEVVLPFKFFPSLGAPQLHAARAPITSTPVFTVDTVETVASLPANFLVQQWDQNAASPWVAYPLNGTLYIFYAVDNGDLDSAASQCFLYYRTSEAVGVWDASNIAFTSAIPGEMIAAFATSVGGFDPVILVGVVNPVTFPPKESRTAPVDSLTDFILFGSPAPPPAPTKEISIVLYGWKCFPEDPCGPAEEVPELPHVKRAV
jgi:hypothetical protein